MIQKTAETLGSEGMSLGFFFSSELGATCVNF